MKILIETQGGRVIGFPFPDDYSIDNVRPNFITVKKSNGAVIASFHTQSILCILSDEAAAIFAEEEKE